MMLSMAHPSGLVLLAVPQPSLHLLLGVRLRLLARPEEQHLDRILQVFGELVQFAAELDNLLFDGVQSVRLANSVTRSSRRHLPNDCRSPLSRAV
jgi:hypothetical protein